MVTPLGLLTRFARPARLAPAIGRCPVCQEEVRRQQPALTLRGGIHVHRECASYRIRLRARGR